MVSSVLKLLTSLRLTVALLVLGIALVFFGTLAQTSDGLWIAQQKYFRSWFVVWSTPELPWLKVPLLGGYFVGFALLGNLIAAHITRFKFKWNKSGIFLTHLGVVALLVGQLATDLFARESRMSFAEGEWRNYSEDFHETELVFRSDAATPGQEDIVAIPEALFSKGGEIIHPSLPLKVKISAYHENSDVRLRGPMVDGNKPVVATAGFGPRFVMIPMPPTREMDKRNFPAVVAELFDQASGNSLGTWLFSLGIRPQEVKTSSKSFRAELRQRRYYERFALRLLKTTHEVYAGTDTPKDFRSRVRIEPSDGASTREVEIYMNEPLRYAGLTFFQSQMGKQEMDSEIRGNSVLQVVRNPSWLAPYAGCVLVGAGLLVQFLIHLAGFLAKPRSTSKPSIA